MAYSEKFKTIVIANTVEAFSAPIGYINDPRQRENRIRIENVLSQRAIFWGGDDKIIITPTLTHPELLAVQKKSLGLNNVVNISPEYISHSLCRNIFKDRSFWEMFTTLIQDNKDIQLTAYSYTKELDSLIRMVATRGLDLNVPQRPHGNPSIVEYLDSKSGFRQTLSSLNDVLLPKGYICDDEDEVINRARNFKGRNSSFVIKANEGESGWGLYFAKDPRTESDEQLTNNLKGTFRRDGIWASRPYVVEEYIKLDQQRGGGAPSTELYLTENSVNINYSCAQLFDKEGEFSGIAMGRGVLDDVLQMRMEVMSARIGKRYYDLGYRGFFDIDFAISQRNVLYALETNARRTGGTHVFDFARRVFGTEWKNLVFYSNDSFRYASKKLPLHDILERVKDLLFPIDGKKEGLVLSLFDNREPILGYILVGNSSSSVNHIQSALLDYFAS